MIVACIGDSLTEGDYGIKGKSGIANVQKENYPYFLAKNTGWTVRNFGKCGFRADTYLNFYKEGNLHLSDADVVVIMLGSNGGNDPEENTPCNEAFRELIRLIKADAPKAKIVLCTPPQGTVNPAFSNCGYMPQILKAVSFVKLLAKEEALPLIDVFDCGYFTPETENVMQPNDGIHFGREGYKVLAKVIEDGIKALL